MKKHQAKRGINLPGNSGVNEANYTHHTKGGTHFEIYPAIDFIASNNTCIIGNNTVSAAGPSGEPDVILEDAAVAVATVVAVDKKALNINLLTQLDKLAAGGYITPAEYKARKKAIVDGN